jgi:hypothetical protein
MAIKKIPAPGLSVAAVPITTLRDELEQDLNDLAASSIAWIDRDRTAERFVPEQDTLFAQSRARNRPWREDLGLHLPDSGRRPRAA